MIAPGLYRHYKKGDLYRVLFVVPWGDHRDAEHTKQPKPDDEFKIAWDRFDRAYYAVDYKGEYLMTARWSGNDGSVPRELIVIYVALYGEGRVSARTMREFEESVDAPCADGGSSHRVPRFERIGE